MFELAGSGYTDSNLEMCTGPFVRNSQEIYFLEYILHNRPS